MEVRELLHITNLKEDCSTYREIIYGNYGLAESNLFAISYCLFLSLFLSSTNRYDFVAYQFKICVISVFLMFFAVFS